MKRIAPFVVAALIVCPLFAQTPGTLNYPTSLDTSVTLFEVANNSTTAISVELSAAGTTATVTSTSTFPTTGAFSVGSEIIYYTGKTATTFTGLVRARQGSAAAIHVVGTLVQGRYTAGHHEAIRSSVISLQTKLGIGSDTPASGEFLMGTGAGSSGWSNIITAPLNLADGSDTAALDLDGATLVLSTAGSERVRINSADVTFPTGSGSTARLNRTLAQTASWNLYSDTSGETVNDGFRMRLAALDAFLWNIENGTLAFGTNNTLAMTISAAQVVTLANALPVGSGGSGTTTATGTAGSVVLSNSPTIVTPTIASLANAQHNHTNAAGGGQLTIAAHSDVTAWTTFTPTRTASAGTWTVGTVNTARYFVIGKKMTVLLRVSASSVSATPVSLRVDIPGGYTAAATVIEPLALSDNTTAKTGTKQVIAADTKIYLYTGPYGTGTWATSTTSTYVDFSFTFEVQ
jgi:hypothetical protein